MGARKQIGTLMAVSGGLMMGTGALHPQPKGDTVTEAAIGMLGADLWEVSHVPQALGMVGLVAVALLVRREPGVGGAVRAAATLAAIGAATAALESIPHMLSGREASALQAGGSTPLFDLHVGMQAVATPLAGFGVAALAWFGSRDARLGPRPLAALGVVGGLGFGLAGPAVFFTESMVLAKLFMFTAGVALWLLAAGIHVARSANAPERVGDPLHVA